LIGSIGRLAANWIVRHRTNYCNWNVERQPPHPGCLFKVQEAPKSYPACSFPEQCFELYIALQGRPVRRRRAKRDSEVLDVLVQSKRNKHAALKLMRKLLRRYAVVPERLVTDDLRSYGAATLDLGIDHLHDRGRWKNNRAENSRQPTRRRKRKMQRFKSAGSAQKFLSTHAAAYNIFNVQRHLTSAQSHRALRSAAMTTWREAAAFA
jgi:putative transposase